MLMGKKGASDGGELEVGVEVVEVGGRCWNYMRSWSSLISGSLRI